jgi:hypothetical protein
MTIPADEAANALRDAEAAAGRSEAAHSYHQASGYLILWGMIWIVGNLASQQSEQTGLLAWDIGALIGVAGSVALGVRQRKPRREGGGVRALLIALAIVGFGTAVSAIAPALSFAQYSALGGLAVGAIYLAMGAGSGGLRLAAVGATMMVATVIGWFLVREYFFLWMAAAGGGGLILGGLWFRKV